MRFKAHHGADFHVVLAGGAADKLSYAAIHYEELLRTLTAKVTSTSSRHGCVANAGSCRAVHQVTKPINYMLKRWDGMGSHLSSITAGSASAIMLPNELSAERHSSSLAPIALLSWPQSMAGGDALLVEQGHLARAGHFTEKSIDSFIVPSTAICT